jgi:RNase adaptor protein for sRNA GlmZ degradation
VNPERTYPFLKALLQPFHKARRKTLGLVIAAVTATGQARSFAIATTLATWLRTRLDSAVTLLKRNADNGRTCLLG